MRGSGSRAAPGAAAARRRRAASDKCRAERRKTINGDDLLWAMTTLGFDDYVEPLKMYLARFREVRARFQAAAARAAHTRAARRAAQASRSSKKDDA